MRQPRFDLYRDRQGRWRWRMRAANGKTIADSAEAYRERRKCEHALQIVKSNARAAKVRDLTA